MIRFTLFIISVLAFFVRCQSPPPLITHFSNNVMTIDYHVQIGKNLSHKEKIFVQKLIDKTFEEINSVYNKWNPNSEISIINGLSADSPYKPSEQLYQFLERIEFFFHLSEGLFDPTVEPLQALWIKNLENGKIPDPQEINALKSAIGWKNIILKDGIVMKKDSRTQIDLGGIAKGLCVDLLVERLNHSGFKDIYVEWGGEVRASGRHPLKRPWRVFISRFGDKIPENGLATIDLNNQALATSGDYFQFWTITTTENGQETYCHIMNPKAFQALKVKKGSIASASMLALDCVTADALAKVLMLFDTTEEAEHWIRQQQATYPDLACWIATR